MKIIILINIFNGLLYCLNYINSLYIYVEGSNINQINFINKIKFTMIKEYNKHIITKVTIRFIITAYLKVNELYNIALKDNLFK